MQYKKIPVKTWYLHQQTPQKEIEIPDEISFKQIRQISVEHYLSVYKPFAEKWGWTGRLLLSASSLNETINRETCLIYFMYVTNEIAGFFELGCSNPNEIELVYMGLFDKFIGKGYGKILLNQAIAKAWQQNPKKVLLHTCEFDHTNALEIYQKAGFEIFREQTDFEYYPVEFLKLV